MLWLDATSKATSSVSLFETSLAAAINCDPLVLTLLEGDRPVEIEDDSLVVFSLSC